MQLTHRQTRKIRNRVLTNAIVIRLLLQTPAAAVATLRVGPVAAQKHPHMHLVAARLLPFEKAPYPIPLSAIVGLFRIISRAFDQPLAVLFGVILKRLVNVHPTLPRCLLQIKLRLPIRAPLKRPHQPLIDAQRLIWNRLPHVQPQRAPKATTRRTRPDRTVKTEQPRRRCRQRDPAVCTAPVRGKMQRLIVDARRHLALAIAQRRFQRLAHTCPLLCLEHHAVLHHHHLRRQLAPFERIRFIQTDHTSIQPHPQKALRLQKRCKVLRHRILRHRHRKQDESLLPRMRIDELIENALRRLRPHRSVAGRARRLRQSRKQHFEVVIDLRDRPHRRACAAHVVHLLDGDRRRDALDGVHLRLVHPLEELSRVGRKRLHIPPLPFRIDRIKRQRRLSRSAWPRDHIQLSQRQIQIHPLQIVLPRPTNANDIVERLPGGSFFGNTRHGGARVTIRPSLATGRSR